MPIRLRPRPKLRSSVCVFQEINFDPEFGLVKERLRNPRYRMPGFWTYIDVRDAAEACRLALEAAPAGHTIFNAAAPSSNMREPTDDLLKRYLPASKKIRPGLSAIGVAWTVAKSNASLAFVPDMFGRAPSRVRPEQTGSRRVLPRSLRTAIRVLGSIAEQDLMNCFRVAAFAMHSLVMPRAAQIIAGVAIGFATRADRCHA